MTTSTVPQATASVPPDVFAAFACPVCAVLSTRSRLTFGARAATCDGCARTYPLVQGVPCLVPNPERFRVEWRAKLDDYLLLTELRQRQIASDAAEPGILSLTCQRLRTLVEAMSVERALVSSTLAPLLPEDQAHAARRFPGSPLPVEDASLLDTYENVFRDWGWGGSEISRALDHATRLLLAATAKRCVSELRLGTLVVLGAGAGRLPADLHRLLEPERTLALDLNPLPLLLANRLLQGEVIEAYEYPVGPRGLQAAAVRQRLAAVHQAPDNFVFALADARHPPFVPGAVETVFTPWFIDVVEAELPKTIETTHRMLRPGGLWLNQGPLRFHGSATCRYSIEEVLELVRAGGFEVLAAQQDDAPYFHSPHSGSRRKETVYGFVACKVRDGVTKVAPEPSGPPWATDPSQPIPASAELDALVERLVLSAGALSLVDGQRSLVDIAEALAGEIRVEPERLVESLRLLLVNLLARG